MGMQPFVTWDKTPQIAFFSKTHSEAAAGLNY